MCRHSDRSDRLPVINELDIIVPVVYNNKIYENGISTVDKFSNTELSIYSTLCLKKQDTKLLPITSPNVNRFSNFFHWQTHW